MKKLFLFTLAALCSFSILTSCKDDSAPEDTSWKEVSDTYTTENLELKVNGLSVPGQSVAVEAKTASTAVVTLDNLILGESQVKVNATLGNVTKSGATYTLEGENRDNNRLVAVTGSVTDGVLKLDVTKTVVSPLAGAWKVKIEDSPNPFDSTQIVPMAELHFVIETPNDSILGMLSNDYVRMLMQSMVGPMIGTAIDYANIDFNANGTFGLSFLKTGESAEFVLPELGIQYYVQTVEGKDVLYGAVPKMLLNMIPDLIGDALPAEKKAALMTAMQSLLVDLGTFYAIPLQLTFRADNSVVVYLPKAFIMQAVDTMLPVFEDMIPEDYAALVPMIVGALQSTTNLEVGIVLTKR